MHTPLEHKALETARILKLLAHPKRLLLLCRLKHGERIVGDLEKECTISQSQLSQFLAKMREDGLVEARKDGQHVYYHITDERIVKLLNSLENTMCQ
jgi:DNA-binding transcriptional ArsR family regulator